MTLHWLCDSPSPYNAQLFRAIAADPELDLVVHYRRRELPSHPWRSDLTEGYRWRSYRPVWGIDWFLVQLALRSRHRHCRDCFVVGGWNHATACLMLLLLGLRNANFAIWSDTPNLERNRALVRRIARERFLRWTFGRARSILGTGRPALAALRKMGADESKLVEFPYWIDVACYAAGDDRERARKDRGAFVFLSTGLLDNRRKGHDIAIRALANAASRCGDPFLFRIAGTGPDVSSLRSLADALGIGERVRLLGWIEPDDLRSELASADVLLHPSPTHEPYGVAVIEAMASGLTVLASDRTCAALDRIEHNVSGLIHRAGDVDELSDQIVALLENPELLDRMGEAAQRTSREWPLERGVASVKQLFQEATQR